MAAKRKDAPTSARQQEAMQMLVYQPEEWEKLFVNAKRSTTRGLLLVDNDRNIKEISQGMKIAPTDDLVIHTNLNDIKMKPKGNEVDEERLLLRVLWA